MRKLIIIFVLVASSTSFIQAQEIDHNYWGLKFGLNLPRVNDDSGSGLDLRTRPAFHASVYKNFKIDDIFGLRAELMYTEKGGRDRPAEALLNVQRIYVVKTNYLSLPLTVQASKGKLFAELGIEPGFQIGVNLSNENSGLNEAEVIDFWTSTLDLNPIFGIGVHDSNFEVTLRYLPGLVNISNEVQVRTSDGGTETRRIGINKMIQLSLAYRIAHVYP